MECLFCGVGEAFDHTQPNTSLLLTRAGAFGGLGQSILLDCGFTAGAALFEHAPRPLDLDAVSISHFHADHFFGLPYLLGRYIEEGRTKDLTVIGQQGVEQLVTGLMETAYHAFLDRARFGLEFIEVEPGSRIQVAGFDLTYARNGHSAPCVSVRVEADGQSVFYSGDGAPTDETLALARDCTLAVHEAYTMDQDRPGHGSVPLAVEFARKARAESLALVHINREVRAMQMDRILQAADNASPLHVFVPEAGEVQIL